ncbi:MAG: hypothetical protein FJ145_02600 [Deltaproteobacteria bacterium]|nr:hypothetical protein [Deltaproteobacteria bacterium]
MRRFLLKCGSGLVALLLALGLSAGGGMAVTKRQMKAEIQSFHAFLRDHPRVSTELQANPRLAGNRKYLDKHEDLKKFLRRHPAVQHEVINHPRNVFGSNKRRR